jgi:hypothetical protein
MPDTNPNEMEVLKRALRPAADCPDLAALSAAASNPKFARHLAGCSRCRTELAMLREFENGEPGAEELASVQWIQSELLRRGPEFSSDARDRAPRPISMGERLSAWMAEIFSPRRRFALSMAGISLMLLVTVGIYSQRAGDAPLANPTQPTVWRSGQFSAVSPLGDITQTPAAFQWESVPGAVKYGIHLSGVDGAEVWSAESRETSIVPPSEIRSLLTPGRAFHWKVEARNPAGETIAATDSQIFHILTTTR